MVESVPLPSPADLKTFLEAADLVLGGHPSSLAEADMPGEMAATDAADVEGARADESHLDDQQLQKSAPATTIRTASPSAQAMNTFTLSGLSGSITATSCTCVPDDANEMQQA